MCVGIAEGAECSVESDICDVGLVCIATDFLEREGLVTPVANGYANGTAANGTANNGTAGNCTEPYADVSPSPGMTNLRRTASVRQCAQFALIHRHTGTLVTMLAWVAAGTMTVFQAHAPAPQEHVHNMGQAEARLLTAHIVT